MALRHRRPDVDRSLRRLDVDADRGERVAHEVAAALVDRLISAGAPASSASAAASCTASNMPESMFVFSFQYAATASALPTIAAVRQPVMFQPFDSEKTSMPTSLAPGVSRKLGAT